MAETTLVEEAEAVIKDIGRWPTLHDARVLSLTTDWAQNTVTVVLDLSGAIEWPSGNTAMLTLRWHDMKNISFDSTDRACAVYGLEITRSGIWTDSNFTPARGCISGSIRSRRVQVVTYTAG